MNHPPKRGEDLPPPLTKFSPLGTVDYKALALLYERALRRIALETDAEGNMTNAAHTAYETLLGILA